MTKGRRQKIYEKKYIDSLLKLHVGVSGFQCATLSEAWQAEELNPDRFDWESHRKVATVCNMYLPFSSIVL